MIDVKKITKRLKAKFVEWLLKDHKLAMNIQMNNNDMSNTNMSLCRFGTDVIASHVYINDIEMHPDFEVIIRRKVKND